MVSDPSVHSHAVERLKERFGVDESWLIDELEQGSFIWLKGSGDSGNAKNVRSGHLIYLPDRNKYRKCCTLSDEQMDAVTRSITEKIASKEMRPYCELSVRTRTGRGKTALISNKLHVASDLESAELAKRWES